MSLNSACPQTESDWPSLGQDSNSLSSNIRLVTREEAGNREQDQAQFPEVENNSQAKEDGGEVTISKIITGSQTLSLRYFRI